jgi:hypothetical protein
MLALGEDFPWLLGYGGYGMRFANTANAFVPTAALLVVVSLGLMSIGAHRNTLRAQDDSTGAETFDDSTARTAIFSQASLIGTYSSTNIGRGGLSPVSDVGVFTFDGNGGFSGVVYVNLPGASFLERNIFRSSFTGTYTVNADGTGTTSTSFTLPDNSTRETSSIFVIYNFTPRARTRIATEFTLIADDLSSTSGNLDVAVLKKIPNGGFTTSSLKGTYGFSTSARGGPLATADAGLTTFDGKGKSTVYFNQNIPGEFFGQRQVFSDSTNLTYTVNPDGTGSSNVAHFVITKAAKIGGQVVGTEVFFITDALDPFTGNLQTTVAKRLSPNPNPTVAGFGKASLLGSYAGKVIGHGSPTQQVTAAVLNFDGNGNFAGSGTINLPGASFGQRIFTEAPFVGTYSVNANGVGTALNGGESAFVITKIERINGMKVASEFALVVKDLQATGNLITATFTRRPDNGVFNEASLRGVYAVYAIGEGGYLPEAGIGTITLDGAGGLQSGFTQNVPGQTFNDRNLFQASVTGQYTIDSRGMGTTITTGGETAFVVIRASVHDNVKIAEELFLIPRDLSPVSRNIIGSYVFRISR